MSRRNSSKRNVLPDLAKVNEPFDTGWTLDRGIYRIIEPFTSTGYLPWLDENLPSEKKSVPRYIRFAGLDAAAALKLLDLIPICILLQRQNGSPALAQLLEACALGEGEVELTGYMIGPTEPDERISVDAFVYYGCPDFRINPTHTEGCQCDELWVAILDELQLDTALTGPDEINRCRPTWNPGREAWWVWWD